ncbi:DUF4397 domain-containing protein [Spirosoma rigui]|uniref:DUF4397 domain-containing protein n=1 Tax=Spirosoma rigui TaxID=564064 RepID=UPI0009B13237|nr:DUF4397 domain-containing protein [Spirosoma rigui]
MKCIPSFLAGIGLAIGLLACGNEHNFVINQVPASGARVKILHAIPDGPAVDVFVNDAKVNGPSLAFYTGYPDREYLALTPGAATLKIATPASATVAGQPVLTANATFEADKYYTVAATGTAAAPVAVIINDDLRIPDASKAYVRVINLLPGGPGVDLAIGTGTPLVSNVAYKAASDFVGITPANSSAPLTLQVRSAGTTTLLGTAVTNFTAFAGRKYTILVRGIAGKTGTQAPAVNTYTTL